MPRKDDSLFGRVLGDFIINKGGPGAKLRIGDRSLNCRINTFLLSNRRLREGLMGPGK